MFNETIDTIEEVIAVRTINPNYVSVTFLGGRVETMQRAEFDDNYGSTVVPAIQATLDNPDVTVEEKLALLQDRIDYLNSMDRGEYCDARR